MEKCSKCGEEKEESEFYLYKSTNKYSSACKKCRLTTAQTWNLNNRYKHVAHQRKWRNSHKELDIERSKARNRRIEHRIKTKLRSRFNDAIKNNQKVGSAVRDLGCSIAKLKIYLQLKFIRNSRGKHEYMTWQNHGLYGWHIDHIKPLSSFDLSDPIQIKQACHYTNLQPLWAEDNLKKGNKTNSLL